MPVYPGMLPCRFRGGDRRVNRSSSAFADAPRPPPNFATGGWIWVYNSAATILQGVEANTNAKVFKAKLVLHWTDPYKILAVGPYSAAETPDGLPLGSSLLFLDLPYDLPGSDARRRVAIECCESCANPTTARTCPNIYRRGRRSTCSTTFSKSPRRTTSLKTTSRPPSKG